MKRTIIALLFVFSSLAPAWCLDNLVVKGRVIDSSASATPIAGLKVLSYFSLAASIDSTVTDASGLFSISISGANTTSSSTFTLWTNSSNAAGYQYTQSTITIPGTVNRNDNKNDTLTVGDIKVAPTKKLDSLIIRGKVVDSTTNNPVSNANLFVWYFKTPILKDTVRLTTSSDGSFLCSMINIYSIKIVKFVVPAVAGQMTGKSVTDSIPANASTSDGTTDIIDHTIQVKVTPSGTRPFVASFGTSRSSGPAAVSLYTVDGRLLLRTTVVDINNFSARQARTLLNRSGMPVIMVWRQGDTMASRRFMLTK